MGSVGQRDDGAPDEVRRLGREDVRIVARSGTPEGLGVSTARGQCFREQAPRRHRERRHPIGREFLGQRTRETDLRHSAEVRKQG